MYSWLHRQGPGDPSWIGIKMVSPWSGPCWRLWFYVLPPFVFAPCIPTGPKLLDVPLCASMLIRCCFICLNVALSLSLCQAANLPNPSRVSVNLTPSVEPCLSHSFWCFHSTLNYSSNQLSCWSNLSVFMFVSPVHCKFQERRGWVYYSFWKN